MSICVEVKGKKLRVVDDISLDECTDFILVDSNEYQTNSVLFTIPSTENLQDIFMIAFSLPIIIYLVSWGFSQVVNFINNYY